MRIGIDGRALTGRFTGDRTYWRNLLRVLPTLDREVEYLLYSRVPIETSELPFSPNVSFRPVSAANDRIWTFATLPSCLRRDKVDLIHVQYTAPPASLCPCPIVTTVHDISFRLYPQWFPARHRILLNLTVPASMRRAKRVITDSFSSRKDILRTYGLDESKVVAIPLGLPSGFGFAEPSLDEDQNVLFFSRQEKARQIVKDQYKIEGEFILAVGVLQPRKNLVMLAKAFGRMRSRYKISPQLVLVGKAGWGTQQEILLEAVKAEGGEEAVKAVRFTGYIPDEDLPLLYMACSAFAYPSLYEGFGLPPLEAMACGAPVLVSDAPAMPEVVGDAAMVVRATEVDDWADVLANVINDKDLSRKLRLKGPLHASLFTWEETAGRTLQVYREACAPVNGSR